MVFMAKNIPALGSAVYTIIKNKTLATTPFIVTNNSISNGKITLTGIIKLEALPILQIMAQLIMQEVITIRD